MVCSQIVGVEKMSFCFCVLGLIGAVTAVLLICVFWWIFPLRLVWPAWSLTVVGGGATILTSTVFSMLTDLTSDEERYY